MRATYWWRLLRDVIKLFSAWCTEKRDIVFVFLEVDINIAKMSSENLQVDETGVDKNEGERTTMAELNCTVK